MSATVLVLIILIFKQSFVPVIIDTTPPNLSGSQIKLKFEDGTLLANWTKTTFTDVEDPFSLQYMFALGIKIMLLVQVIP